MRRCHLLWAASHMLRVESKRVACSVNVRRILVRGEEHFENLTTKWCILKYI